MNLPNFSSFIVFALLEPTDPLTRGRGWWETIRFMGVVSVWTIAEKWSVFE